MQEEEKFEERVRKEWEELDEVTKERYRDSGRDLIEQLKRIGVEVEVKDPGAFSHWVEFKQIAFLEHACDDCGERCVSEPMYNEGYC